jgi:toxin ParE1/3/4
VPEYRLSKLARLDLSEIADYTVDTWGEEQAVRYLDRLADCFERLASHPQMGRLCPQIRTGYRRMECEMHVVFYRTDSDGVIVGRVLHKGMLPTARLLGAD